jgi:hypothetical protein
MKSAAERKREDRARMRAAGYSDLVSADPAEAARLGGGIPGQLIQTLNTRLGNQVSNPSFGSSAKELQNILRDATARQVSGEDAAVLTQAKAQWRAYRQLAPDAEGNISLKKAWNTLNSKKYVAQTRIDLQDPNSLASLVRAAKNILPDTLGNSGTAGRIVPVNAFLHGLGEGKPLQGILKQVGGVPLVATPAAVMRNQAVVRAAMAGSKTATGAGAVTGGGLAGSYLNQTPTP